MSQLEEADETRLSDEKIAKVQTEFELQLERDVDLPDAITGRRAFVYWHLMRKWFRILVAQSRYNEEQCKKIKLDWLRYLDSLDTESRLAFLSTEKGGTEKEREQFGLKANQASTQIAAIEEAFAAHVGQDAMNELARVNGADVFAFDRTGKKPMAPVGHHYFPVSIRPYVEELKVDASKE